jgi:hypothetical protein
MDDLQRQLLAARAKVPTWRGFSDMLLDETSAQFQLLDIMWKLQDCYSRTTPHPILMLSVIKIMEDVERHMGLKWNHLAQARVVAEGFAAE